MADGARPRRKLRVPLFSLSHAAPRARRRRKGHWSHDTTSLTEHMFGHLLRRELGGGEKDIGPTIPPLSQNTRVHFSRTKMCSCCVLLRSPAACPCGACSCGVVHLRRAPLAVEFGPRGL